MYKNSSEVIHLNMYAKNLIDKSSSMFVKKLNSNATIPSKAFQNDLGYDLHTIENVTIEPSQLVKIHTGIAIEFPGEYGAFIKDRSSIATKRNLSVVAGVIDQGYSGEIIVALRNFGYIPQSFIVGEAIAQLVLIHIPPILFTFEVEELADTDRNIGGFGSSNR